MQRLLHNSCYTLEQDKIRLKMRKNHTISNPDLTFLTRHGLISIKRALKHKVNLYKHMKHIKCSISSLQKFSPHMCNSLQYLTICKPAIKNMKFPSKQLKLVKHLLTTAKHLKHLDLPRNLHPINLKSIAKLSSLTKVKLESKINSLPLHSRWPKSLQKVAIQLTRNNNVTPESIQKAFLLVQNLINLPKLKYLDLDLFSTQLSLDMEPIYTLLSKLSLKKIPKWWIRIKSNTLHLQDLSIPDQAMNFVLQANCLLLWNDISLLTGGVSHLAQGNRTLCLNYQYNPQLVKVILSHNSNLQKLYLNDLTANLCHLEGVQFPRGLKYLEIRLNELNVKSEELFKYLNSAVLNVESLETLKVKFLEMPHEGAELEFGKLLEAPCMKNLKEYSFKVVPQRHRRGFYNINMSVDRNLQVISKGIGIFQNLESLDLSLTVYEIGTLPQIAETLGNISVNVKNLKIKVQVRDRLLEALRESKKEVSFILPFERLKNLETLYLRLPGSFNNQSFYRFTSDIQQVKGLREFTHEGALLGNLSRRQLKGLIHQLPKIYKSTKKAHGFLTTRYHVETYYTHSI